MKTTIVTLALMCLAAISYAQQTEIKPTTPGNYNVNITNDSNQLVLKSYVVTGVAPENRANLAKAMRKLLLVDGKSGGTVLVSAQSIGGKNVIVLAVTATVEMQKSIANVVEQINRGESIKFNDCPAAVFYRPKFRSVKALEEVLKKEITCVGYVYSDEETNTLTYGDDPTYISYLDSVVKAYDVEQDQAVVEVTIIETKKGTERSLGLYWDAWKQALPTNISAKFSGSRNLLGELQVSSFDGLVENISPQALAQFVNYLETVGVAQVRSKTKLNIVNGRPAVFHAGKDVPFKVVTKEGSNAELDNKTAFEGLELKVDSIIGSEAKSLVVKAVSTSIVGTAENGAPLLSNSVVETSVCAKGEKSFVLSGLETTKSVKTTTGIPLLCHTPVIKILAAREVTAEERWDVNIVIHVASPQ